MFCRECGEIIPRGPLDLRFCPPSAREGARKLLSRLLSRLRATILRARS